MEAAWTFATVDLQWLKPARIHLRQMEDLERDKAMEVDQEPDRAMSADANDIETAIVEANGLAMKPGNRKAGLRLRYLSTKKSAKAQASEPDSISWIGSWLHSSTTIPPLRSSLSFFSQSTTRGLMGRKQLSHDVCIWTRGAKRRLRLETIAQLLLASKTCLIQQTQPLSPRVTLRGGYQVRSTAPAPFAQICVARRRSAGSKNPYERPYWPRSGGGVASPRIGRWYVVLLVAVRPIRVSIPTPSMTCYHTSNNKINTCQPLLRR
jgi:hypothetical protein